jgi:hypothetical protein
VVQQRGAAGMQAKLAVDAPQSAAEQEADAVADTLIHSRNTSGALHQFSFIPTGLGLARQQRPGAGGGAPSGGPPSRRIIYIDANVFDQINRGNQAAAQSLNQLRASGADLRVSQWTYRELVQQPDIPRTAAANRLLINDLGIQVSPPVRFAERVELALPNQGRRGQTVLSAADAQVVVGARAGGGEVWSFDGAFRNNPQNIQATFGVQVAPESQLPMVPRGSRADYRVGRRLLGLPEVEISLSGVVRPRPGGGGAGGGGAGGGGQSPPGDGPGSERAGPPRTPPPVGEGGSPQSGTARAEGTAPRAQAPAQVRPAAPIRAATPEMALQRQRLIMTLEQQTRSAAAFTGRLQNYVRVAGGLLSVLEVVSTVSDALSIAANGTVMPDVQRQADQVERHARDAAGRAQETYDSISLLTSVAQVSDAIERQDTAVLFDLSSALGNLALEVSEQAYRYGELRRDLRARSRALRSLSDLYLQLAAVPQGASTAPNAQALAMHISLQRLSGTLGNAANQYDSAFSLLSYLGRYLSELASRANREAWGRFFAEIARMLQELEAQQATATVPPGAPASSASQATPNQEEAQR